MHKLTAGTQDIPPDVQKTWDKFRLTPESITLSMPSMYHHYSLLRLLFFSSDPQYKHVLLLDQITSLFPNVAEISCEGTDCVAYNGFYPQTYSPSVVGPNFIVGLQRILHKVEENTQHNLKKITISTLQHEIADNCNVYASQFGRLGWQIEKQRNALMLKHLHNCLIEAHLSADHLTEQLMPTIAAMIHGAPSSYTPTAVDVDIFNKLTAHAKDVPSDVQKTWDKFMLSPQSITISMRWMYYDYSLFIPLFFSSDPQYKHVLLLDQVTSLFPNVAEITCEYIDYEGEWNEETRSSYSAAIVSTAFLLGLQERLDKIAPNDKLTKITIQTQQNKITCDLAAKGFGALGWDIQKETAKGYAKEAEKHNQITLTKRLGASNRHIVI